MNNIISAVMVNDKAYPHWHDRKWCWYWVQFQKPKLVHGNGRKEPRR